MGKPVRDKNKVRKVKTPPVANSGPVKYNFWKLIEGSWSGPEVLTGKNRRTVAKELAAKNPSGSWKLRLA